MIPRLVVVMLGLIAGMLPPVSFADDCSNPAPFQRLFERDVSGGNYYIGEDAEISLRLRGGSAITADFKTVKPYRTKEFGSGVAFWFCDARGKRVVRVAFRDVEGEETVHFSVFNFTPGSPGKTDPVIEQRLSLPKARAGRVRFQKSATGRLTIEVDDQTFSIDPGFEMHKVLVQVYCADGWARFIDGELVS